MKSLADHLREIERTERMKYLFDHPAKSPLQKLRRSDGARNYSWSALPRLIAEVEEARKILSDHCRCAEDWPVDGAAPTSAFDIYDRAHRFLGEEEK